MMVSPPEGAKRVSCPCCGRYLGTVEGTYLELPPCACGFQTTVRAVGGRARRDVEMAGERIEVKTR